MKALIDRAGCIGCTLCATVCPDVFSMAKDGKAQVEVTPIPDTMIDKTVAARDNCPVSVIDIDE